MQKLVNPPEQIIRREFAGDLTETLLRLPKLLGHQLAGASILELALCFVQMSVGAIQRVEMAAAGGDRAGAGALESHAFF